MRIEILDALQKLVDAAEDKGFSESVARFRLERALPAARAAIKELKAATTERKIVHIARLENYTSCVDNQGYAWELRYSFAQGDFWYRLPPLPQDDAL